ncbi:Kelch-like protein 8 [Eumeta japonica]|uniref:Kelch-like protein 8 n=1 Tax=Eumeta variegata TaxID=151549 RepID=A0A4C1VDT3_EUMVA|nr:Kelch-like protein 8 [Eumeta japonica]
MSAPRCWPGAAALGGRAYAVGGHDGQGRVLTSGEVYDPRKIGRPRRRAAFRFQFLFSGSRRKPRDAAARPSVYPFTALFGPLTAGRLVPELADASWSSEIARAVVLDTPVAFATDTWTPIAPMRTARKRFALAALRGKLYALGGYKQSSIEAYDPATDEWAEMGEMPEQRWDMGVVTHAGRYIYQNDERQRDGALVTSVLFNQNTLNCPDGYLGVLKVSGALPVLRRGASGRGGGDAQSLLLETTALWRRASKQNVGGRMDEPRTISVADELICIICDKLGSPSDTDSDFGDVIKISRGVTALRAASSERRTDCDLT